MIRAYHLSWESSNSNQVTATVTQPITLVQNKTSGTVGVAASVAATFNAPPTQNNLLVHHYNSAATVTLPTGWTMAADLRDTNDAGSTITIAYKIATASEGANVTVSGTGSAHQSLNIFEYTGIATTFPVITRRFIEFRTGPLQRPVNASTAAIGSRPVPVW